ncbi:MAG: indolepyruvate ferredoxin oxidoreductase, alpha subunit [Thermosediminibacterales bacterium]|nr:indolepyruvate ferredoxin oxidoreductase, alpha subunit [Thermosediminibacterales bacterium]
MKKLLLGNEAVAQGAYEAGVRVVSAYPGTPSTEITENVARFDEIYTEWAPNEKVALEVAVGAAIAGARAMACMKHVGLNVAADPLFTSSYTGINGGLVIVVADDPGMHSSQNEQDSRYYGRAAHIPVLEPSDSQEAKDFTKLAFEISEKYDTPVILRMATRISHSRSLVEIGQRSDVHLKDYTKDIGKYVMMPAMARRRRNILVEREKSLKQYSEEAELNRIEYNDRSIGIIAAGGAYNYAKEAVPGASFLKLGMVYPLPEKLIKSFAREVERLFVIEELETFIEDYVRTLGLDVIGKELFPKTGELSYEVIASKLKEAGINKEVLNLSFENCKAPNVNEIPLRPPALCPGCPHRGVYYVLKKLNLTVTGDIGCYTLGALPPLSSMDTCICMGASVSSAHGLEKARGKEFARKTVAVIGDSTFIHSGITGLIDVVYNNGTSTVIILDNSTTGMTGHQEHPATGYDIKGRPANKLNMEKLCEAVGVKRVRVEDPFEIKKFQKAVQEEISADEPSVIIARRPCALLKRVKSKNKPYCVNTETCIECGLCLELGCPAITNRSLISIDETMCNGCGLCADVCPTNSITRGDICD